MLKLSKEFIINKKIFSTKVLKELFINTYGNFEYEFSENEIEDTKTNYKHKYKNDNDENIDINDIIFY